MGVEDYLIKPYTKRIGAQMRSVREVFEGESGGLTDSGLLIVLNNEAVVQDEITCGLGGEIVDNPIEPYTKIIGPEIELVG